MGKKSDPLSVVDETLKVHGVKNLRIVDTSVMPKPASSFMQAAAFAVAEKAADLILSQ